MRGHESQTWKLVAALALATAVALSVPGTGMFAHEPTSVAGGVGGIGVTEGRVMTWDLATLGGSVPYTTDGGALGTLDNAAANALVTEAFGVWEAVPTSSIAATRTGAINSSGTVLVTDGDVSSLAEFDAVTGALLSGCPENPVIYDADGSLFDALGRPRSNVGFAGAFTSTTSDFFFCGRAVLNGRVINGIEDQDDPELPTGEVKGVMIHEFGHFFGGGHAQVNLNCLTDFGAPGNTCTPGSADLLGLPTMFPISIGGLDESAGPPAVHFTETLSEDDMAGISRLYPKEPEFSATYGEIEGTIFFSDGVQHLQDAVVIARKTDSPRSRAIQITSGFLFKGNFGNPELDPPFDGPSPFGTDDPAMRGFYSLAVPAGDWTVEIESIHPIFLGGSSVGVITQNPLSGGFDAIPLPGPAEFFNVGESATDDPGTSSPVTVVAGGTVMGVDIIVNDLLPVFDGNETAGSRNDSVATATPIGNGTTTGSISPFASADRDFYKVNVTGGTTATFEIKARRRVPPGFVDSVLEIVDGSNARVSFCDTNDDQVFTDPCLNDDHIDSVTTLLTRDSRLLFKPAATGDFFVHVSDKRSDSRPDFVYDLEVSGVNEPVVASADLAVTKTENVDPVTVGNSVTYTITVTNNGPDGANNVTLTDTFTGAGVTITSVVPSQGSCDNPPGNPFNCDLGAIASGANATVTVAVTANVEGTITNTVSADADENDPDAANNTNIVQTTQVVAVGACTINFDGGPSGSGTEWNVAENWDADRLPAAGDVACIGGSFAVTLSSGNHEVETLLVTSTAVFTQSGGVLTINSVGSSSIGSGGFVQSGGTVTGPGTLNINGLWTWTGGTQSGNGVTNANGGISLSGAASKTLSGRTLNHAAGQTTTHTDAGNLLLGDGAVFNNNGSYDLQSDASIDNTGLAPRTFNNNGIFTKSGGAGSSSINPSFTNTGEVNANSGTLGLNNYTQTAGTTRLNGGSISSATTIQLQGGLLEGANNSSITGDINQTGGTINPGLSAGILNLVGGFTQDVNGTLVFEIGGLNPGTGHDQINASGSAVTNGTINVVLINGFVPSAGDTFTLASAAGGGSGNPTVNLPALPAGLSWEEVADPNALIIRVVATQADLAVTKTDDADPVTVGNSVTYTVTITNNGPADADSVSLVDTFSGAAVTISSITPSQGTCDPPGNPFNCNLGPIASGNSATVTITVTADQAGTITNTVSVTGDKDDPDTANNQTAATTTVNAPAGADIEVTKTEDVDPVTVGNSVTYTITVTNNGPDAANNVTFTDTFSGAGVSITSVGTTQGTCDAPGNPFNCSLGTIASGASVTITITVTANQAGTITNTASATANETDPNTENNTAVETTTVNAPQADLGVAKADSVDPVIVGATLTYTVTVTNNGPDAATNVTVSDTLPAGTTFVSASAGCVHNAGVVTCNLGDLASGANTVVTIEVTAPLTEGVISNTASVTSIVPDPNLANNTATEDTTVTPAADLEITKTDDPDPVAAEGTLAYTVTVTNNGPSDASGVTVTDTLPGGTTFVSASAGCVHNAGVVSCNIGNLANGAGAQVTITVTAPAEGGTITNSATVTGDQGDPNTANNTDTEDTTVNPPQADLTVSKGDSPDPVAAGATLTYTVTVTNNGPNNATNVVVTDTLPAGTTFVSAAPALACTHSQGTVTCNIGDLANGATVPITITVTAPTEGGSITNSASASSDVADPNPDNNSASEETTVNAQADLEVDKSDSPDPVAAGSSLTYTVTVRNNGPSTATGVTLTDTLPAGTTFVSSTPDAPTCTGAGGQVTCNLGNLAPGASTVVNLTVSAPATPGTITNTASVTATEPDPNAGNNSNSEDTDVTAAADLAITKSDSPDPVDALGTLTYTVTVTNNGPSDASGVTVSDTLPGGTTFVSASAGCVHNAGVVSCNIGNLANGAGAQVTITVTAPAEGGTITNSATVTGDQGDPNAENNTSEAGTEVIAKADLEVGKTDAPDPVGAGEPLTYTVTVTNNGPSTATGVTVTDTRPGGTTFVSAVPSQGNCNEAGGVVTCNLGSLASGASATVVISLNAPPDGGLITNNVTVDGNEDDPVPVNNSDAENTTVEPRADLQITKADSADPVTINASLTYTLTVRNNGPSAATGVNVVDTLPATVTFDSVSTTKGNCNPVIGGILCALGSLAKNETVTITIQVTTPGSEQTVVNNATVSGNETDPVAGNDSAAEATDVVEIAFVAALNTAETFATATIGGSNPLPRGVTVTATVIGSGIPANAAWQASTDVPWAVVQNTNGNTPGTIRIAIDIAGLAVGTHMGTLTVFSPVGLFFPVQAKITLVLNPAPPGNVDTSQTSTASRVDGLDLIKLGLAFGSRPGDPNFNPAANLADSDTNGNGVIDPDEIIIDGSDLAILAANFGNTS